MLSRKIRQFCLWDIPILLLCMLSMLISTTTAHASFSSWSRADFTPRALNSDGTVSAGYRLVGFDKEALIRKQDGTYIALGALIPGGTSDATDISGDGTIVVGTAQTASAVNAFRWTQATGMVSLGSLPGGLDISYARGISRNGTTIVGDAQSSNGTEAFRWTQSTGMVGLGDLSGGFFYSEANAVNDNGSVIVGYSISSSGPEAFRWTQSTGMVGLGDLPGGIFDSVATGVSSDGSVVIGNGRSSSGQEAFRWTEQTGMQGLGFLPGGTFSKALAISGNGAIIVGSALSSSGGQAFRWTDPTGMRSLKDLLSESGVPLSGFSLTAAGAISEDGTIIVGLGEAPDGSDISWIAKYDDGFAGLTTFEDVNKSLEDLSTLTPRLSGMSLLTLRSLLESQRYSEDSLTSFWGLGTFGTDDDFSGNDIEGYGALGMTHFLRSGWSFGGGVFLGNTLLESSFGGRQKSTLVGPGIFVGYMPEATGLAVKVGGIYNYLDLKLDRAYSNGTGTTTSEGDTDGYILGGVAHISWLFAFQQAFIVQPFFQYEIQQIEINKYTETTGPLPAKYDSRNYTDNKTRLGLETGYRVQDDLTLSIWGAWNHRFEDEGPTMKGELIGVTSFNYGEGKIDQDWADAGVTISWIADTGVELLAKVGFAFDNEYYAAPDQYVQIGFSVDF